MKLIKNVIIFLCILAGVVVFKATWLDLYREHKESSLEALKIENKELKEELETRNNYDDWKDCLDNSDSTELIRCDSMYNEDLEFIY